MAKTTEPKRVALAIPAGVPHVELHVRGILRYAAAQGHWAMEVSPESNALLLSSLRGWSGDGVLVLADTAADARLVAGLGLPAVNLSGALERPGIPRVSVDNRAIGRLAAEHLGECGLRHFAYYGVRTLWYAQQRGAAFAEQVRRAGGSCAHLLVPHTLGRRVPWSELVQPVARWLKSLPRPVGVFACSDHRARMVLDACRQLGLRVPDDVAILGVNNDAFACEFCDPPLSSVSRNGERVGYEAAALLDRLMAGKQPPKRDILVPPDGIVLRRSTDWVAIDDAEVATAVRYMREHLTERLTMEELAQHQGVSRRWLQDAFRRAVGRSPHQYLNFLRTRRARQLLAEKPRVPLEQVARASGFSSAKRLRLAFLRVVGVSPREFGQAHARRDPLA